MYGIKACATRKLACLAGVCCLAMMFAAPGDSAKVADRILATVDGEPLTLYDLDQFAAMIRASGGGGPLQGGKAQRQKMLEALITERLVRKEAAKLGLTASDEEVDSYLEQIQRRNKLSKEELKSAVVQQGLTWDIYREKVRFDIERGKLLAREIGEKVTVSPEEIERYYQAHLQDYKLPERIQLWHILIPAGERRYQRIEARKVAEECLRLARKGKDFGKLASKYSVGPGAKAGGDIGTIERGQMMERLEEAAFALKEGEISDIIETEEGFHIFKAGKRQTERYRPLSEVSEEIRRKLYDDLLEERYQRWLKQDLRARHHVEIISPVGEVEDR